MSVSVDLAGEVALVIGGTRNIGLAVAHALAGAGARLCVVGRSDRRALDHAIAQLRDAMGLIVDATDEAAVVDLYRQIEARLGAVSILVNCAGLRPAAPLTDISRKAWADVVDVMLTAPFLTSRELFKRLPAERRGAIVNIGGLSAYRPVRDRAHVIAAKAGVAGLTRALAEEGLGRIRANCVVPGLIDTERKPGQPQSAHADDQDRTRGTSEDVARAVLYFADPRDVYVTGQTVHVSGGRFMP